MKPSYMTNLMSSFYLWLDHELLNIGQGFTVTSGKLYPVQDCDYAEYNVYGSPFRQWVSDSSINNTFVPSGVYVDGVFKTRNDGIKINYEKGQVLINKSIVPKPNNVTTQYTKKDFNIYYTTERDENILFENAYTLAPKFPLVTGALENGDQPIPCIFLKNTYYENKPYALGGQDKTITNIRCIVLADNMYLIDGAISVMTDSVRKVFPVVSPQLLPYNYYGDFKSGDNYNYSQLTQVQNTNLAYIDRVSISRFDEITNNQLNPKIVGVIVDFEIWQAREPRKYNSD